MPSAREEVAERIGNELAGLAREARTDGLDTLAYLIDMARLEAASQSGRDDQYAYRAQHRTDREP
jgi:hypothetical protein